MKCDNCGAMVTAEEKFKKQKNGNTHHYVYYHCTRRKDPNCTEKAIEIKGLNKQIDNVLENLNISERFQKWALKYLHEVRQQEAVANVDTLSAKQKTLEGTTRQLQKVALTFTSPDNENEQLMTQAEYAGLRNQLLEEKTKLEDELKNVGNQIEDWVELSEKTFNFARYARTWFAQGDLETKKAIFACLGSHLLLKDQKLSLALRKPFQIIFENGQKAEKELLRLEPLKNPSNISDWKVFCSRFPVLSG